MGADTLQPSSVMRVCVCVCHEYTRATCARQVPACGMHYDKKGTHSWSLRTLSLGLERERVLVGNNFDRLINRFHVRRFVMTSKSVATRFVASIVFVSYGSHAAHRNRSETSFKTRYNWSWRKYFDTSCFSIPGPILRHRCLYEIYY